MIGKWGEKFWMLKQMHLLLPGNSITIYSWRKFGIVNLSKLKWPNELWWHTPTISALMRLKCSMSSRLAFSCVFKCIYLPITSPAIKCKMQNPSEPTTQPKNQISVYLNVKYGLKGSCLWALPDYSYAIYQICFSLYFLFCVAGKATALTLECSKDWIK